MQCHTDTSRFNLSIIIVFIIFWFVGISAAGEQERVVTMGIYENSPKVFTGENGKPEGIFVDIIEEIARREGWRMKYLSGTWQEGLDRLQKGEIDLMPDVAYTAERQKIFSFHQEPVISSWSQVYGRKGSNIRSIMDLNAKKVAILAGSVQQETFTALASGFALNITLVPAADYKTAFAMVAANQADAAVSNNFFGLMNARKYGLDDTAVVFSPSRLLYAGPLDASSSLLAAIDRHLREMKGDTRSVYYASLRRWTADEVEFRLPEWVKMTGIAALVALLFSIGGGIVLKRKVNVRTAELRILNREMEQRIVARTAELARAMEKAQAADRIKSAFLATMSHELRTPLNSIIGFTGILLQDLAGPLNPEQRKQMAMVQTSARHLLALINDVLDISKIEAGQLKLSIDRFDLKTSLEKMLKVVEPLAAKKGIQLQSDLSAEVGLVVSDQRRLEQVFLNLLNNAVKFTDKGTVFVSCRNSEGREVVLSVTDTGIGIKPEEIASLFQPFHQIDTGLSRKHEGTGLGLSISRKIVDLMGGAIEVKSHWGEGSTFTVRLPLETGGTA